MESCVGKRVSNKSLTDYEMMPRQPCPYPRAPTSQRPYEPPVYKLVATPNSSAASGNDPGG